MNKLLRGSMVAGAAIAVTLGFGAQATAAESAPAEAPVAPESNDSLIDIDALNGICALPWFWQGPLNLLVGNQEGDYVACNGGEMEGAAAQSDFESGDLIDIDGLNGICALPWFWQGPVNLLIGNQEGEYVACNGGGEEVPAELEDEIKVLLPEGTPIEDLLPEDELAK